MTARLVPRLRLSLAALAVAAALGACGGGGDPSAPDSRAGGSSMDPLAADVVVKLRPGSAVADVASRHGLTVVDQFGRRPIWRLRVAPEASADAAVTALRADPGVVFAERNVASETPEGLRRNTVWAIGEPGQYAAQWAPAALRLSLAHAQTVGTGIRVAVLDTGADLDHPALAGQWLRDSRGAIVGRDFVDDDAAPAEGGRRDPNDPANAGYGHGTHVAGLIALTAPGARLMPVRVLDAAGRGNSWVLAEAIAWALDPDGDPATDDGAHVINLSLGTTEPTDLLRAAVAIASCAFDDDDDDDFADAGFDDDRTRCGQNRAAVVLAAAGNGGSPDERLYPGAEQVKGSLAVTASRESRNLAPFANSGGWIALAAPGEAITSTVPGGGWGVWSGTSMAAPWAAGVAALVLTTEPPSGGLAGQSGPRRWTPEETTKRLVDRTRPLCNESLKQVDAAAAVRDEPAPDPGCS
jgi:subtilisin family serine protease